MPIVVQKKGNIVRAGNARLIAAKELGWTEMAAVFVSESDLNASAYAIADNRTGELAEWEDDILAQVLKDLNAPGDFDFLKVGFSNEEMEDVLFMSAAMHDVPTGVEAPDNIYGGMPEFEQNDNVGYKTLIVRFKTEEDFNDFQKLIVQEVSEKAKSIWHPKLKRDQKMNLGYVDEK